MMTLLTGLLLTAVIVIALYAFGVFNTPYMDAFRVTFYLLLVLLPAPAAAELVVVPVPVPRLDPVLVVEFE